MSGHGNAQNLWIGGSSGEWINASNWSAGSVPGSSAVARFIATESAPQTTLHLTIGSGTPKAATASALQVWSGMEVNISMMDGASLVAADTNHLLRVGYSTDPAIANAASVLSFSGPTSGTASVQIGQLLVGASAGSDVVTAPPGGHRVTFSGSGLTVTEGDTKATVIGRFGDDNRLEVLAGAHVTRHSVDVSATQTDTNAGKRDNQLVVEGAGSFLTVQYALSVGSTEGRSNVASIESLGFTTPEERATLRAGSLNIGRGDQNFGGNTVRVGKGGALEVFGTTTVQMTASNAGDNDGFNRLVIEDGGIFRSGGNIESNGLVALHAGGVLEGRNPLTGVPMAATLTINPYGRLEIAGSGLAANVKPLIQNSYMAVGISPEVGNRVAGEVLTLQSSIAFHASAGGVLEMTWFGEGDYDRIHFLSGGALTGGTVRLDLQMGADSSVTAGQVWTLFDGATGGIGVNFYLGLVDTAIWDTSQFNSSGGWRVVAIPEPGSLVLTLVGVLFTAACVRRRRTLPRGIRNLKLSGVDRGSC